jgi:dihydropyrimidine dehydrogenase (NAD+) subunit PreT
LEQFEQDLAQTKGVKIKHWVAPKKVQVKAGKAVGITCDYMTEKKGKLVATGETFDMAADVIFKAIGQTYIDITRGRLKLGALKLDKGRIAVDSEKRTSVSGIWAGGDCAAGGKDLTVAAVDDGRRAAESINAFLSA